MKKLRLLAVVLIIVLACPLAIRAEDAAKYNFASAQGAKDLTVVPGNETIGFIYFYNIDGNRITHITLDVGSAPDGWLVAVDPPVTETSLLVDEVPVTVTENLYVEPSQLLSAEPASIPSGMISINVPGRGYTLGKQAQIKVFVPENVPIGTKGSIKIAGEAAWLGQGGSAAVKQARDFEFNVTVVSASKEYSEKVVVPGEIAGSTANSNSADTAAPVGNSGSSSTFRWLPVIIAVVVVIIGVILVLLLIRKKS